MKQELINTVLSQMMPYLNNDQAARLQEVLEHSLFRVTVTQDETPREDTILPLDTFIAAKKIEGCSEKTLVYYRKTVQDMLDGVGKPAQQIMTDDLRKYLSDYQEQRKASKVTIDNIRRNGLTGRVTAMQLDALRPPLQRLGDFDCIVSNPPYIPSGDIPGLDASVRDYEPHMALDGGADGLDFYRNLAGEWKNALTVGGKIFLEVGIGQADDVLRLLRAQGFGDLEITKDLNGIPRVVHGTLWGEI